jgi:hypothetical protein
MTCAAALHDAGAVLLTTRFHDHGAVFGLPGVVRRQLHARIEQVNRVYDEVHATFGGHRVDLAARLEPAGGVLLSWRQDLAWLVTEGGPWVGRRARDLGPWAVRMAWEETRPRRAGSPSPARAGHPGRRGRRPGR